MTTEPAKTETVGGEGSTDLPPRLEAARRRFAEWRGSRAKVGPIPEDLWGEAARCAAEFGSHRTARALGLDSGKLTRRLNGQKKRGKKKASRPCPTFVEVAPARATPTSECVLEIENRSGARVRIQLRGVPLAEVAHLARSLSREGA